MNITYDTEIRASCLSLLSELEQITLKHNTTPYHTTIYALSVLSSALLSATPKTWEELKEVVNG